jgi:hypothetical protein
MLNVKTISVSRKPCRPSPYLRVTINVVKQSDRQILQPEAPKPPHDFTRVISGTVPFTGVNALI